MLLGYRCQYCSKFGEWFIMLWKWLLRLLDRIPLINSLLWFPPRAHAAAILKFCVLWLLTSLPVIVAVLFSPMPESDGDWLRGIFDRFSASISVSEQFVYTASFLAPVLYIFYEKYRESNEVLVGRRLSNSFEVFSGYGWVFIAACLLILFTGLAFTSIKTSPEFFKLTYLNYLLTNYSAYVYFFALYCWYLSLLDSVNKGDFVGASRAGEQVVVQGFSARLQSREVEDNE